jgi:NADH-quinone oxidoreductase subunit J
MFELIAFYVLGAIAVIASLAVVGQRNPMHSVLWLIASFGALAGLYVTLDSPFAAVTQIIVYAGAIMVLFLFVVMLLNAPREDVSGPYGPSYVSLSTGPRRVFLVLCAVLIGELIIALKQLPTHVLTQSTANEHSVSSVQAIGVALFTDHAFAFEVTSVLILVAMVGAVVLAKKHV